MILFEVVYRPSTAFATLKEHPRWLVAFFAVSICQVLLSLLHVLTTNDGVFALDEAGAFLTASKFVVVLIRNLTSWFFFSVLLYYLIQLFDSGEGQLSIKLVFSVIVHSNVITLLGSLIASMVSFIQWLLGTTPTFVEKRLIGMNALSWIITLPEIVVSYIQRVDVFTIWYFILVSYGLCLVAGLKKSNSAFIVFLAWFVLVSLQLIIRSHLKNIL